MPNGDQTQFVDAEHGWTASGAGTGGGVLSRTTDGGATWRDASLNLGVDVVFPDHPSYFSMHFRNSLTGVVFAAVGPGDTRSGPVRSS